MNFGQGKKVISFNEIHSHELNEQLSTKIKNEIEGSGKEYILGVDEEEYKKYLIDKFTIEPLAVDLNSEQIDKPTIKKEFVQNYYSTGRRIETDVCYFTVRYPFTGSSLVFRIRPSSFRMISEEIYVNEQENMVSISFKLYNQNVGEFNMEKDRRKRDAFTNLQNANNDVRVWNNSLSGIVNSYFNSIKSKFEKENDFFAAINVSVNKDTNSVFTAPTIKKKIIPQPTVSKNKEFSSEPMMSKEMYDDILKVIYELGKSMEKKPSTYHNKDEEGLRDQILLVLETRYDSTSATGETFNREGKTDIILKYTKDSSNLFVAECKFWHGGAEFLKAISQLFDKYLTWRDSKTALIIFVTNKDFSNVLQTITTEVKNHPYYLKEAGKRGETSYSYIFHLPQDKNKNVHFEIIAFHYDKLDDTK